MKQMEVQEIVSLIENSILEWHKKNEHGDAELEIVTIPFNEKCCGYCSSRRIPEISRDNYCYCCGWCSIFADISHCNNSL